MSERPSLDCPECGVPLISAQSRGRYDCDGNYIEHRDGCGCQWCDWMWFDDMDPVTCACGAVVGVDVDVDDGCAYAKEATR